MGSEGFVGFDGFWWVRWVLAGSVGFGGLGGFWRVRWVLVGSVGFGGFDMSTWLFVCIVS